MRRLFVISLAITSVLAMGACSDFRSLGTELKNYGEDYRIAGVIENADEFAAPVRASIVEWNPRTGDVFSGDQLELSTGGAFVFSVRNPYHQHVGAFADSNRNSRHDEGEPLWVHGGNAPVPLSFEKGERKRFVRGRLKAGTMSDALRDAIDRRLQGHTVPEIISNRGARFSLGEIADLDDPRFAATRGEDGLWTPATMAIRDGFGVYFLQRYDPGRTPVIFIHGAAGSPQDWRTAMERIDRQKYQPWFYFYPSGGRLESAAKALHRGIGQLQRRYGFSRLHIVAHSMGGLVARRCVEMSAIEAGENYINTLVTFSSPWSGHEAAAAGVRWAPAVVPSWRDMEAGSPFLNGLFRERLKGKVNHHLIYGYRSRRSPMLPDKNDGTVSVASELRPEAIADAASVDGYNEDHVSILSAREPLKRLEQALDAAPP